MLNKDSSPTVKSAVMFVSIISAFMIPFMVSSINIALPSIGQEFDLNAILLSWIPSSYLLASAIFLIPFGRIADIFGRKRVMLIGMCVFTASSFLCGISQASWMLLLSRVLQGVGSSMIFSTNIAMITSTFPTGERGKRLGINVASTYLGLSAGPFLGGLVTQYLGWRALFIMSTIIGFALIISILMKIKTEWKEAHGDKLDLAGLILYALSLLGLAYGFSKLPGALGWWLVGTGITGFLLFGYIENLQTSPLINVRIFRTNRIFVFSALSALINYSATYAVSFLISLYLQYIKGLSARDAGLALIIQPVIQAILSPYAGKVSDKTEPRKLASAGMASTAIGLLMLSLLNKESILPYLLTCLALIGLGNALFSSPNTNSIMSSVAKKEYGVASSVVGTSRVVGQIFSMNIVMLMISVSIGSNKIIPEYHLAFLNTMRISFTIFSALCFIGMFLSYARGKKNDVLT